VRREPCAECLYVISSIHSLNTHIRLKFPS
jgi:hypothetical protein